MEELPVVHDLNRWNALLRESCGQFDASLAGHEGLFVGGLQQQEIDGLALTRIRTNAGRIVCRKAAPGQVSVDDRYCFLVVQRQGSSWLGQHGTMMELLPGDMVLLDAVQGCEIVPRGLMEHVSVRLERQQVVRLTPESFKRLGKIGRFTSSSRLACGMLEQICSGEFARGVTAGDGKAMQQALLALVCQSWQHVTGQASQPWLSGAPDQADDWPATCRHATGRLLAQARSLIDQDLADPLLSPPRVAGRMGISLRQLYRLFESADDSVSRYIQRARLRRAAGELRSALGELRSITDIAFGCGFNDAAHFSRAFRKQFGVSPREYRQSASLPSEVSDAVGDEAMAPTEHRHERVAAYGVSAGGRYHA